MNKGFTLVELIAVMVLLGVMGLIATVTVSNEIKENRNALYNVEINNFKTKAALWAGENMFSLPTEDGAYIFVTLAELKDAGFSDDVVNPITKENFPNTLKIKITAVGNTYTYDVIEGD